MSDNPQTKFASLFNLALDNKDVRALASTQAEAFWKAQARILDQYDTLAQELVDRRRQGTDAALNTAQRICGCADVAEANAVCNDWVVGSIERMIADSRALGEMSLRLFQEAMGSVQTGASELGSLRFGKAEKAEKTEKAEKAEQAPRAKEAATELRRTA